MSKSNHDMIEQMIIPFEDIIENLRIPSDYNFSKLKKVYLPNNPLTDLPLFLPSKSAAVNESRKRFNIMFKSKGRGTVKVDMNTNVLEYSTGNLTIHAAPDYGLPDEFDGQVFDCILMLISKEYVKTSKTFKGYRIDELAIMQEFEKQGMKPGGSLYNRIKYSLNRMAHTSYVVRDEQQRPSGATRYLEVIYRLIDGIYRKGEMHPDGQEFSKTVVLPHSSIINSIEEKQYHIISNTKRYQLRRHISKAIYDKLFLVAYAQMFARTRDIYIAQKGGTQPFFVVNYQKFCDRFALQLLPDKVLRPSKILQQLSVFIDDLKTQNVIHDLLCDKRKSTEKDYNLVFIFTWEFIETVFEVANKSMGMQNIGDIGPTDIAAYYKKMETQISSRAIKNKIKGVEVELVG